MSAKPESETYLSGFCSGGAEWAHDRCPGAYNDKPCRCECHQEHECAGMGCERTSPCSPECDTEFRLAQLAEALCQAYHPTRWEYAATRQPCLDCEQAAPAVLEAIDEEDGQ